jgi:hypothetical protein
MAERPWSGFDKGFIGGIIKYIPNRKRFELAGAKIFCTWAHVAAVTDRTNCHAITCEIFTHASWILQSSCANFTHPILFNCIGEKFFVVALLRDEQISRGLVKYHNVACLLL